MDQKYLEALHLTSRALSHGLRSEIIDLLKDGNPRYVTQIQIHFRIDDHSLISQHLKILREAGFVNTVSSGKKVFYALSDYYYNMEKFINEHNFPIPKFSGPNNGLTVTTKQIVK
jgi:DNA-binding transcriptional ArsR family regulator